MKKTKRNRARERRGFVAEEEIINLQDAVAKLRADALRDAERFIEAYGELEESRPVTAAMRKFIRQYKERPQDKGASQSRQYSNKTKAKPRTRRRPRPSSIKSC